MHLFLIELQLVFLISLAKSTVITNRIDYNQSSYNKTGNASELTDIFLLEISSLDLIGSNEQNSEPIDTTYSNDSLSEQIDRIFDTIYGSPNTKSPNYILSTHNSSNSSITSNSSIRSESTFAHNSSDIEIHLSDSNDFSRSFQELFSPSLRNRKYQYRRFLNFLNLQNLETNRSNKQPRTGSREFRPRNLSPLSSSHKLPKRQITFQDETPVRPLYETSVELNRTIHTPNSLFWDYPHWFNSTGRFVDAETTELPVFIADSNFSDRTEDSTDWWPIADRNLTTIDNTTTISNGTLRPTTTAQPVAHFYYFVYAFTIIFFLLLSILSLCCMKISSEHMNLDVTKSSGKFG